MARTRGDPPRPPGPAAAAGRDPTDITRPTVGGPAGGTDGGGGSGSGSGEAELAGDLPDGLAIAASPLDGAMVIHLMHFRLRSRSQVETLKNKEFRNV
jgi:hypothetical protein